ncbi:MAG: HNH endonuclease [Saprospiraceae bacterium]|nr:HNH endonuclease [Saprospiraceae bacterium]
MKEGQRLWTRDELILAMNLYCKLPFGRLHNRNPEIIHLASLIDRTPSSVALKLVNFASLDPSIIESGRTGASNTSKLDKEIWSEFYNNWDILPYESEKLLANYEQKPIESLLQLEEPTVFMEGKTREQLIRVRINQSFFRKAILASYNGTCCITGLQQPELLIAGHIMPWSKDEKNRLNPRNGILINALHDKAFEIGLITIDQSFKVQVSSILHKQQNNSVIQDHFLRYDGKPIIEPTRFLPDLAFLNYHNTNVFKG